MRIDAEFVTVYSCKCSHQGLTVTETLALVVLSDLYAYKPKYYCTGCSYVFCAAIVAVIVTALYKVINKIRSDNFVNTILSY